jgi:pyruvate/2-oxoglutarate/acetoin dehydrogenase E1 component
MIPQNTFAESIFKSLNYSLEKIPNLMVFGLGVNDPKSIFGTTKDLSDIHGIDRVFDVPCSENALTGIAVGSALNGVPSVTIHQRMDFFLLAMDQLINSAAKMSFMSGGKLKVPLVIRLIIGKGWGQGPTHSQNFQNFFTQIPGLKVVSPFTPQNALDLLFSSIQDPNPVIFIEHRWLHDTSGPVTEIPNLVELKGSKVIRNGENITIVSSSYYLIECIKASNFLSSTFKISCELIDLQVLKPINLDPILKSLLKTENLLVVEGAHDEGSTANKIISDLTIGLSGSSSRFNFQKITFPDFPTPTSHELAKNFYPDHKRIVNEVLNLLGIKFSDNLDSEKYTFPEASFDSGFNGPF